MSNEKYYGKYRGIVTNNIDPELRGRLMVTVPDVLGLNPSSWAEACVPFNALSGQASAGNIIPPVGLNLKTGKLIGRSGWDADGQCP